MHGNKDDQGGRYNQTISFPKDLAKLLKHTTGTQLHDIILLAAMTGLRRGELLGLTWEDVDLKQGTLLVHSTIGHTTKGERLGLSP